MAHCAKEIVKFMEEKEMKIKRLLSLMAVITVLALITVPVFAAGTGDVAGAVQSTWTTARSQIKDIVNNVVFPVMTLILAVFFFIKLGGAYFDYRKNGQFEWTAPAILFGCLIFIITAPTYLWGILGM